MAAQGGEHLSEIKTKLMEESTTFSFVQAVRLLLHELVAGRKNGNTGPEDMYQVLERQIRVRPELSLRFPGTDITGIERLGDDPETYLITATFLGLYGASSPLPTFYTEDLIEEQNEDGAIKREFVDIINYALYPLFFKIWSKYQLLYKLCEEQDKNVTNLLYCLLGLENDHLRHQIRHLRKFFRYTGLALQMPRSTEGLDAMITDCFDLEGRVRITQCVLRKVEIPEDQRLRLGQSCCTLDTDAVLGEWVYDISGKFRITIQNAGADRLHSFLPGRDAFVALSQIIHFYVNQPLECDLELELNPDTVETARLGEASWSNLGQNTWLFSENMPKGDARAVFPVK